MSQPQRTKIEWTEATWNPVRGCKKISPGCKFCYAERFAERFRGHPGPYQAGFTPRLVPERLLDPLRWSKPAVCFVNSTSDIFQDDVPDSYIVTAFDVMRLSPWNVYQILTKRAERMHQMLTSCLHYATLMPHIWMGVSVEDRQHGAARIELLRRTQARVRFLSVEPLLEDVTPLSLRGIDWVIVGGESGPGARPMHPDWVEAIRLQCLAHGTSFFFKQWGGVQKKKTGRLLHGCTHDDMPPRPQIPIPPREERLRILASLQPLADSWLTASSLPISKGHQTSCLPILP